MSTDILPLPPENSQTSQQSAVGTAAKAAVKVGVLPPSPRLRLWQVLREEYLLFHPEPSSTAKEDEAETQDEGKFWTVSGEEDKAKEQDKGQTWKLDLEPDFWELKKEQLEYPQIALGICRQDNKVAQALAEIIGKETCLKLEESDGDQVLSDELRANIATALNKLLEGDGFRGLHSDQTLKDVLAESEPDKDYNEIKQIFPDYKKRLVNRWLLEESFPEGIVSIDESLTAKYYQAIHAQAIQAEGQEGHEGHSALCLSGGGIRSATFNLGLLQGLARHGLLEKFDYLSTVSGGGFSGGWLSAWIKRHPEGLQGVMKALGKGQNAQTSSTHKPPVQKPLEPEPQQLAWLRSYSNFLSPKLGLFTADTWTLVATLLRNIFLNWLVFVPVLMAALILPRLWVAFVTRRTFDWAEDFSLGIGFLMGMLALAYIGIHLPSMRKKNRGQGAFLMLCLAPLLISAMALATYGMRVAHQHELVNFIYYQILVIAVPWIISGVYQFFIRKETASGGKLFVHFVFATVLIGLVQVVTGWLLWKAAMGWGDHILLYACFAVPVVLALFAFTGLLLAGLTSNYTGDDDQEWWARAGAWVFIAIIGWNALSVLVIYGPRLLVYLVVALPQRLRQLDFFSKEVLTVVGGIVSGAISLYGGFSAKTPANDEQAKKPGLMSKLLGILVTVATAVFLIFILLALALLTNVLVVALYNALISTAPWHPSAHRDIIIGSPGRLLLLLAVIMIFLVLFFGWLINTNKFSLHYLWRNRIIRAYLGSSNPNRRPNLFTGFDRNDDLPMHELKPKDKKLFHVLNFALNLVGGEKLAWQERKAESFTASPLHCGNYHLGYRRSRWYGGGEKPGDKAGKEGITLGTSIAISGAFVSPNMGYMQTSPVIRFLMTLFNVRFGWWLGNSGRAGGLSETLRTYDRDSPRLSVVPIVEEALGMTDDESDYIYLSDGGHFENFGLYEMVLRRCHLIVVGDATSDAEYAFESLGQSLRKIRIDFGIPIDFTSFAILKPSRDKKGGYAAIAKIRYGCIDGANAKDGTLILIKPTLTGTETRDILNYATKKSSFPQEFIGDQWFSESQFESYRALGSHIVDALCKEPGKDVSDSNIVTNFEAFITFVKTNSSDSGSDFAQKALEFLRKSVT